MEFLGSHENTSKAEQNWSVWNDELSWNQLRAAPLKTRAPPFLLSEFSAVNETGEKRFEFWRGKLLCTVKKVPDWSFGACEKICYQIISFNILTVNLESPISWRNTASEKKPVHAMLLITRRCYVWIQERTKIQYLCIFNCLIPPIQRLDIAYELISNVICKNTFSIYSQKTLSQLPVQNILHVLLLVSQMSRFIAFLCFA